MLSALVFAFGGTSCRRQPASSNGVASTSERSSRSISIDAFRFFKVNVIDKRFAQDEARIYAVRLLDDEGGISDEELYLNAVTGAYKKAVADQPFLLMGSLPGGRHPSEFEYRVASAQLDGQLVACELEFTYFILPGAGPGIPQVPYFLADMPALPQGDYTIEFRVVRSYVSHGDGNRVPANVKRDALERNPYRAVFSLPSEMQEESVE